MRYKGLLHVFLIWAWRGGNREVLIGSCDSLYMHFIQRYYQCHYLRPILREILAILLIFQIRSCNFLMRYPDSFSQRRKVVALGAMHNILKAEVSRSNSFWDMRCQSFYLIRAYRKMYGSDLLQKVICPEPLITSIILRSFSFLSKVVSEILSANQMFKKNNNN